MWSVGGSVTWFGGECRYVGGRSEGWSVSLSASQFGGSSVCRSVGMWSVRGSASQLVGLGVSVCQYVACRRVSMLSLTQYVGLSACQFGGASALVCQSVGLWSVGGSVYLWSLSEGQYVVYW